MSTSEERAKALDGWRQTLRHAGPMNDAEQAEYDAQRAREMHRAEKLRQPADPQLDLPEAA